MRQATVTLTPAQGGLHPADIAVAREPAVERRSIQAYSTTADGSWTFLYAVAGDLERGRALLADRADVRSVSTVATGDDRGLAFVHVEPSPTLETFREIDRTTTLVVTTPIRCLPDGGVRLTAVGTDAALQAAIDRVPGAVAVTLETITGLERGVSDAVTGLPPRQREVLETAVAEGYYAVPRECTQRELAAELAIAPSTLSEHLQKVEARVFGRLAPD